MHVASKCVLHNTLYPIYILKIVLRTQINILTIILEIFPISFATSRSSYSGSDSRYFVGCSEESESDDCPGVADKIFCYDITHQH